MKEETTLGIDYGSKHIGVALVRNHADGGNTLLFAGTLDVDQRPLKEMVEPRAGTRRVRRARKTKKARLDRLGRALASLSIDQGIIKSIARFCARRGQKSLFKEEDPVEDAKGAEELVFKYSREDFFGNLENELKLLLPEDKVSHVLQVCGRILNRHGDRDLEVRPIRIENRGRSRCAWEGCQKVTPQRSNAAKQVLLRTVYTIFQETLKEDPDFASLINEKTGELEELSKRYRSVKGDSAVKERKALSRKASKVMDGFRPYIKRGASVEEEKVKWKTIRENILNIVKGGGGRDRYCREHSDEYLDYIIKGKAIPFKPSLTEAEITSRREEIMFAKLWRYIEARALPLAAEGVVNRVVVERAAFDILGGSFKQKQKLSPDAIEALYQQGPKSGFKNTLDMLKAEFGGLCAYCGKPSAGLTEVEHILPRASFMFDGYLNLLPACPGCNRARKGARTPAASSLRVHPAAYDAYSQYVSAKKPPHILHTRKKGILNLMRQEDRVWEAEHYLALIAKGYSETVQTQRAPRPLARYLCEKLRLRQGRAPVAGFLAGRHTALYRCAAYPEFDKAAEKMGGGKLNHAVDAAIIASRVPSASALEGFKFMRRKDWAEWAEKVREKAPDGKGGLPLVTGGASAVQGFEENTAGYISANMARFNWNRQSSAIHREDIYGWSEKDGFPYKRVSAASLAEKLEKAPEKKVGEIIGRVRHKDLRAALEKAAAGDAPGKAASEALKAWLRVSLKGSLAKTSFTAHPADVQRKDALERFLKEGGAIPVTVGVRMRYEDPAVNLDLVRVDKKTGKRIAVYRADTPNAAVLLCYLRSKLGEVDRGKPYLFYVKQSGELRPDSKKVPTVPAGPLKGRAYGLERDKDGWKAALRDYLRLAGVAEYFRLSQGSVLKYSDGSERFIVNFSTEYGFKKGVLKDVVSVRRSPLSAGCKKPFCVSPD